MNQTSVVPESQPVSGAPIVGSANPRLKKRNRLPEPTPAMSVEQTRPKARFIRISGVGDVLEGPLAHRSAESLPKQDHCRACIGGCVNISGSEHARTAGGCRPRYQTNPNGGSLGDVQMAFTSCLPVNQVPCLNGGPFRSTTKHGF